MINWPTPPSGSSSDASFYRRLLDCCMRSVPKVGPGLIADERPDGIFIRLTNIPKPIPKQVIPPSTFPFQIYTVANQTSTPAQQALFTAAGLSISTFTVQIRSGIVGARTYFNNLNSASSGDIKNPIGNFEQELYVPCTDKLPIISGLSFGNDFYYPQQANTTGLSVILDNSADTLLNGATQIVLNQNVEDGSFPQKLWSASFWVAIIDDPILGFTANLMGRMYSNVPAPSSGRNQIPFPSGPNIIPIGVVEFGYMGANNTGQIGQYFEQIQGGNCVNRFPPDISIQRGRWNSIFNGKVNVNFYPRDIVVDDSAQLSFAGIGYYGSYQCIAAAPISTQIANVPQNSGNWQMVGMVAF